MAPYPAEMAEYAVQVFGMALTMPELAAPPLMVALIIGVAGSLLLSRLGHRRRGDGTSVETPRAAGQAAPRPR